MNPLLECGNPFTIPSWLYFTWRWVQLFGMAGVALYLVSCLFSLSEPNFTNHQQMICHSFVSDFQSASASEADNIITASVASVFFFCGFSVVEASE